MIIRSGGSAVIRKFLGIFLVVLPWVGQGGAHPLGYLEGTEPFYPHRDFPKLITPQWIGETNVDAAIILAIDDMRDPARYELYLRPILSRLKQIDGRAPVSIFCNAIVPDHPQLQTWLREGLSLEVHTLSHPCPLLQKSNLVAAANTYHGCVDLLNQVAGNRPVAFRMPCCDSMNSPSPRFYAEIFSRTNSRGQFLTIDSSVMNLFTTNDAALPAALTRDQNGRDRFRKYLPFPSFVTTIEDYPYPYVIGKTIWEFPPLVPSDWEAQNIQGTNNPVTVADWRAALDAAVLKQGLFTFIFHPHGWIKPEQLVEFIDYAVQRYGTRVKFLNFREAEQRLTANFLGGQPLRAADGGDNGVRVLDLDGDRFLDVVIGNSQLKQTRLWLPGEKRWQTSDLPVTLDAGARFGRAEQGRVLLLQRAGESRSGAVTGDRPGMWRFENGRWISDPTLLAGLPQNLALGNVDAGVRFRDLDRDSVDELLIGNSNQNVIYAREAQTQNWKRLPFALPGRARFVDERSQDAGLRLVDLNADGYEDVVFANERFYGVYLFINVPKPHLGWDRGWSYEIEAGTNNPRAFPPIVRAGEFRNNGAWFHSGHLWLQNEDTADLPDKVERRSFSTLISGKTSTAKSPQEAFASLRIRPGFKIELVATEPQVRDPVAFEWAPDGKLWVADMRDYPLGMDGKGKPGGEVRVLEDADGDGFYERSTLFLDGIGFPSGVMPWRKGALISTAPDIIYAEDTDGDGRADSRKVLLTGFVEGNQQHRVNGFEYGLDNWVYAANGDSSGTIRSPAQKNSVELRGHDLRFRPDSGDFETVAGQTQFGRRRDDAGNWFGNNNPNWAWHYFLPEHYLKRNPVLAVSSTRQLTARYPNATRVFSISEAQKRFNWPETIDNLTSANSATPYRDELFGAEFSTSLFISEPAHNVVHREVLEPSGVTFTSHRAAEERDREFLAATDNWFRPTMLKTGPDGAMYLADMYRLILEHPEYFPEELKNRPDLRAGDEQGRIYRFFPTNVTLRSVPNLTKLNRSDLVRSLESPNGWVRDTAQKLLVQKPDSAAVPLLKELLVQSQTWKGRLHALYTLDGVRALTSALVAGALRDRSPVVREHALRLAEPYLQKTKSTVSGTGALTEAVLGLENDPEIRVRFQLGFTLGEWADPRAPRVLLGLAAADPTNEAMRTAVLSSAPLHAAAMLAALGDQKYSTAKPGLIGPLLAVALNQKDFRAVARGVAAFTEPGPAPAARLAGGASPEWQFTQLAAFLDSVQREKMSLTSLARSSPDLAQVSEVVNVVIDRARQAAADERSPESLQLAAIRLLGRQRESRDLPLLAGLLDGKRPQPIQRAALGQIAQSGETNAPYLILDSWARLSPALRPDAIQRVLERPEWCRALLTRVAEQKFPVPQLSAAQRQRLLSHPDRQIRERAVEALGAINRDRQKVLGEFQTVTQLTGDPGKGEALFVANCAVCHRFGEHGNHVGPDLGTVADKSSASLLAAILDPNQAVDAAYVAYQVVTRDGREVTGVVAVDSPNNVVLRTAAGAEETLLRRDLQDFKSSPLSLMPEGFEKLLTPQDLADLITFLQGNPKSK